jgi:hypothetical protein
VRRQHAVTMDEVALHHQTWSLNQPQPPAHLAGSIAEEIASWLDHLGDAS